MTEQLDRYQLEQVIGVGSFATVQRAHDQQLDDTVVVKILAENHSLNPEIRERFIAEGRSLRRVASQHVVTVHDIGETRRLQPYLVLEYADRGTLADRVESLGATGWQADPADILALIKPLVAALEAVHQEQLVHRDLSPGNLLITSEVGTHSSTTGEDDVARLVTPGERLLLADLGMCKDLAFNSGLTVSGGTAGFRPPEQSGPGLVDTRADIWAATALLQWITEGSATAEALDDVIRRGLNPDPDLRQQSITGWGQEIEDALRPPEPEPEPSPELDPVPESSLTSTYEQGEGAGVIAASSSPAPGSTALKVFLSVVVLCFVAAVSLGVGMLLRSGGPPAEADGASVAIEGPETVTIGEAAEFTAEVDGAEEWVWTLPTGTHATDDEEVVVTPMAAGSAEVVLRATTADGEELEARHSVTVEEE